MMKAIKLKVGDVLKATDSGASVIVIFRIMHFHQEVYFDCMYFCDYRGLARTDNFHVTITPADLERFALTKIDI